MTNQQLKQFVIGKVVADLVFEEFGFDNSGISISKIIFQDGSSIELTGLADQAYVSEIATKDGKEIPVYPAERDIDSNHQ